MKKWLLTTEDETTTEDGMAATLEHQEKCTKQFALNVNKKQKCLSNQKGTDPYTVENVIENTENSKLMFSS